MTILLIDWPISTGLDEASRLKGPAKAGDADSALVIRALLEERVLGRDARYRLYCGRVGWHLVPLVF